MTESLFSTTTTTDSVELLPLIICILVAVLLGLALAGVYCVRNRHTRSFVVTLAVLPAIVCAVIALVNGNVGTGVAVAGTFSLVRFRSVPGSARDIGFVFLAMCVGLACGMGYLAVGAITTILLGGIYLIYQLSGFGSGNGPLLDRAIHISIPEDLDYTSLFDDIFERYLSEHELASVSTANMGSVFKLVYNVRLASNISEKALIDEIRCRNGNLEVALTHQEIAHDEL
jgi:hypothetical protein